MGPVPELAFTGLTFRVSEENSLCYAGKKSASQLANILSYFDLKRLGNHELHTLSGGESVRVALVSMITQKIQELHIDCSLEQLDEGWREMVFSFLENDHGHFDQGVYIVDNRLVEGEEYRFKNSIKFPRKNETPFSPNAQLLNPIHAIEIIPNSSPVDILVKDVAFYYKKTNPILTNVNLHIKPGVVHLLEGANGSGKSTFVKILTGTLRPRQGNIFFDNVKFCPWKNAQRYVTLSFQNPDYQWTTLTIGNEIFYKSSASHYDMEEYSKILSAFGIPAVPFDSPLLELPYVIKKRLGIALSIISNKPWKVLDEPTVGQDMEYRISLAKLILDMAKNGTGIVVITHDKLFSSLLTNAQRWKFENGNIKPLSI